MKLVKTIPLFLILFLLLTDCNLFKKYEHYEGKLTIEIGDDLIQKIEAGKYEEVEDYLDYLVKKKPSSIDGTTLLEEIYIYISNKRDISDTLDKWIASKRNHHSAFIIRGLFYMFHGWRARGTGYGYKVSEEGGKLFRNRLQLAKKDFERAYEINPSDPNSASGMIEVCTGLGFNEQTMESWFQKAVKADIKNLRTYVRKLNYLYPKWRGSHQKAYEFAHYCYENSPKGSIIYSVFAHYLFESAHWTKNEKAFFEKREVRNFLNDIFDKWIKDYPNSTSARVSQSILQHWLGNHTKSIKYCSEALKIDPNYIPALAYRGKSYCLTRKKPEIKKAVIDFMKIIENDPYNDEAYYMLGNIAGEFSREYENAIKYYDMAISLNPTEESYFFRRGSTHVHFGEYRSAIEDLKKTIEIDARHQLAYKYLCKTYEILHEKSKAQECYKKATELRKKRPEMN
jgi:tetratricopeptide (TPR) repeat protein